MRRLAAVFVLVTLAAGARASVLDPLPVRDEFLLNTGYLTLSPSSAEVLPDGQQVIDFRVTSSNTFALSRVISRELTRFGETAPWRQDRLRTEPGSVFVVDGETQRTTLEYRRGLPRAEVFVSVPIISTASSWSDGLIERFHSDFDLGSDGRSAVERGRHFVYMRNGTREVLRSGKGRTGVGDLTVGAKLPLRTFRGTALAAEALVELPTGNAEMLLGSGSVDAAINLLASRSGQRSHLFAATGVTRLGANSALGVSGRTLFTASLGYSREIVGRTAATVQITTADSPFKGLGWSELGERTYIWSIGLQHQLDERQVIHLAFIENAVNYENSADFAVQIGISILRP